MRNRDRIRLLFWNTFLLKPRPIPGGPGLPAFGELAAPVVAERARRIGATLGGRFDVVALAETFELDDRQRILDAWSGGVPAHVAGPERSLRHGPGGFTSSGLFTLVDGWPIVRRATHRFATRGSYRYDADALANKGVLLCEVESPGDAGNLEVFSTHLLYGTGLLPGRTANDPHRRHALRMAQVDEMVAFIEAEHRADNTLMLVGDMNIRAVDPDYGDGPGAQYDDLCARLDRLGLVDIWRTHGTGDGFTCGAATDAFADQRDPDDADALVDAADGASGAVAPEFAAQRERIDYAFIAPARNGPSWTVSSIRRYAFPRAAGAPASDRLVRLSDHLALGVELLPPTG